MHLIILLVMGIVLATAGQLENININSDICVKGYIRNKGKCVECWKDSEYSDRSGLSTCKKCTPGKIPFKCDRSSAANCGCKDCSHGYYGPDGSTCKFCRKEMSYSDAKGSVSCKKCKVGTYPYECSDNYGHCGCFSCPAGKMGTSTGRCVECNGVMQYSDNDAAVECKNCTLGSFPYECLNNYGHCGCRKCSKGTVGNTKGQCLACMGASEYSDVEGASNCKICNRGSYTYECGGTQGHCGCTECSKGSFGTEDRGCRLCDGSMEYSDTEGSKKCKNCYLGSTAAQCMFSSGNCGCSKCSKGKYGTEKGFCKLCNGTMEYSDVEGSASCKKCIVGSIPDECGYKSGHCGCSKCSKGKYGTEKGFCKLCNGTMEYSDVEGSTSCNKCSVGSIPDECTYNNGNCGCSKCSKGKYGTKKGQCKLCDGTMEYSDAEGSISCKKCSVGSIPDECGYKSGHCGCSKCSKGKYGTKKGLCKLCNGTMEYSDTEGSTSCKKCSVGSIPNGCPYSYGNCGCNKCKEGSYGSLKGKCLLCDGPMEYSDEKGATSCKKCPAGTRAYRCSLWHNGNCGCYKNKNIFEV